MPDKAKVIKGLEVCVNRVPGKYVCNECPYEIDGNNCEINLTNDAISLLKEQEAKPIAYTDNPYTGLPVAKCPNCGKFARQFDMAHSGEETHFCPWCGQEVKWNDF